MAKSNYSHDNFSAGQYDREYIKQNSYIHKNGFSYCKNVMSSVQGECKARPGTKYQADIDSQSVIIPFRNGEKDIAILINDNVIDFMEVNEADRLVKYTGTEEKDVVWNNTSNDTPEDTAVKITGNIADTNRSNFYKSFTATSTTFLSDYTNNRFSIIQSSYPTVRCQMKLNKALSSVSVAIIPAGKPTYSYSEYGEVEQWIKDAYLQYSDDGEIWYTAQLSKPFSFVRKSMAYGIRQTINPVAIKFEILNPEQHAYWRPAFVFDRSKMSNNAYVMFYFNGMVKEAIETETLSVSSPYTSEELRELKYTQQYNEMYITHKKHLPIKITVAGGVTVNEISISGVTDKCGNPACTRFFQNRLWFGGFDAHPNRVVASEFDNYSNFTVPTTNILATSPIVADCNQIKGRITDLWGGFNVLYAQSEDGVAFIEAAGDAVAPTRMNFTLKCYETAAGITPIMKDNIMFYVGQDRKKIYAFQYDNNVQQFVAPDVSQFWQEVLKNEIVELQYTDSRSKNILGTLKDGTMFSVLYDKAGIIGYFPIDIGARVYDISIIKNGQQNKVLLTAERSGKWNIEEFVMPGTMKSTNEFGQTAEEKNNRTQENLKATPYIDCWKAKKYHCPSTWTYDPEEKTITSSEEIQTDPETSPNPEVISLPWLGSEIRMYYGPGINDYDTAFVTDRKIVSGGLTKIYLETISGTFHDVYTNIIMPIKRLKVDGPVIIQDNGVYQGLFEPNDGSGYNQYIVFDDNTLLYDIQYGQPYEKIAVITEAGAADRMKQWGTIAISVIDTMALQVGASMKKLEDLVEYKPNLLFYNSNVPMYNETILKNIADTDELQKNIILYSDKGLPFCINGLEAEMLIADKGGN